MEKNYFCELLAPVLPHPMRITPFFTLLMLLASSLFLPSGCGRESKVIKTLSETNNIMDTFPDSVLAILLPLEQEVMNNNEKAIYGVLLAQALDKCHYNIGLDSLLINSVEYFDKRSDMDYKIRSNYYLARSYYLEKKYSKAMIYFKKAQEVASAWYSLFWEGMAWRGI
ncbi:MAG: hypothetical protein K2J70_04295, partial [Muribaculaceae bacterium]|nr:hypothetical protein [Muribaculaceae bacterium]